MNKFFKNLNVLLRKIILCVNNTRDNKITTSFKLHIFLYGESGSFQREDAEAQEEVLWNPT